MAHLSLRCPGCQAKLRAPFALIGQMCSCPRCKYRVDVRPPVPTDAEVVLIFEDEWEPARPGSGTAWR